MILAISIAIRIPQSSIIGLTLSCFLRVVGNVPYTIPHRHLPIILICIHTIAKSVCSCRLSLCDTEIVDISLLQCFVEAFASLGIVGVPIGLSLNIC